MSHALRLVSQDADESGSADINRALQAGHQLVSLLEFSKQSLETVVALIPDFFAVLDTRCRVLKGNEAFAKFLRVDPEEVIGQSLSKDVLGDAWELFRSQVERAAQTEAALEFETCFEMPVGGPRCYIVWTLRRVDGLGAHMPHLVTIYGRDVTRIREAEERLSHIFATIPMGILLVNAQGLIEAPASAFAGRMFSQKTVVGHSLRDILFEPAWGLLSEGEREAALHLLNAIGGHAVQYEMNQDSFLKSLPFPRPVAPGSEELGHLRYALTYQPLVRDDVVCGLLVVVEDTTLLHEASQRLSVQDSEDKKIAAFLRVAKQGNKKLLWQFLEDGTTLFSGVVQSVRERHPDALAHALHGIKGICRVHGFADLAMEVHEFESWILFHKEQTLEEYWNEVDRKVRLLQSDWRHLSDVISLIGTEVQSIPSEVSVAPRQQTSVSPLAMIDIEGTLTVGKQEVVSALNDVLNDCRSSFDPFRTEEAQALLRIAGKVNMLLSRLTGLGIESLEPALQRQVQETAKLLGKEVTLTFFWSGISISDHLESTLKECLLHLLNNAVDHGIDLPSLRAAAGKGPQGQIVIRALLRNERLMVSVEDDGAGINVEFVVAKALERGVVQEADLRTMDEKARLSLITRPGFSTADKVTIVSGRGVGLDVVATRVKDLGGSLSIERNRPWGTRFVLEFPLAKEPPMSGEAKTIVASRALVSAPAPETLPLPAAVERPAAVVVPDSVPVVPATAPAEVATAPAEVATAPAEVATAPAEEVATAPAEEVAMASAQGAQTRTILVVDDSSSLRKSLMSVLRKEGYAVEEAVDGSDGYEKIMAKQYALVLTDQNMPNLDGISMCERVKKEKPNHGTPIFMLTTETNVALKAAGKAAGILAWIVKPFDEKNLLKAIEKILSRPAA